VVAVVAVVAAGGGEARIPSRAYRGCEGVDKDGGQEGGGRREECDDNHRIMRPARGCP
jgi:hypothetical protein